MSSAPDPASTAPAAPVVVAAAPQAPVRKKLPITANQVTVVRILALPFPCWALLARPPDEVMWVAFFFVAGAANIYFVRDYAAAESALRAAAPNIEESKIENLDCATDFAGNAQTLCETAKHKEDVWANFKVPGTIGLTIVFILLQGLYLARHLKLKPDSAPVAEPSAGKEKN